jgi:hypothetical protein
MSASMCASAGSLLAPGTPRRSRYRAACSGLIPYTVYPAAASAATHRPRPVSIPILTSSASPSWPRCSPIMACSRVIPAAPSGSRALASVRPEESISPAS